MAPATVHLATAIALIPVTSNSAEHLARPSGPHKATAPVLLGAGEFEEPEEQGGAAWQASVRSELGREPASTRDFPRRRPLSPALPTLPSGASEQEFRDPAKARPLLGAVLLRGGLILGAKL